MRHSDMTLGSQSHLDEHREPLDSSELLELRTGSIAAGGGCVARAEDGRVVFVRHSIPGELVLARVTAEHTSYLRADAVKVLQPADGRVEPPCPYAGPNRCGGCDWQHIALPVQRELKAALVSEQLRRVAAVDRAVIVEEVPGVPSGLAWRTRTRFAVDQAGHVGLRRHRSHDIERIDSCLIASRSVEAIGVEAMRWPGASEVEAFAPTPQEPTNDDRLEEATSLVVVTPGRLGVRASKLPSMPSPRTGLIVEDQVLRQPERVEIDVLGFRFQVSAGVFWQVHQGAPAALVRAVLDNLAPRPGEHVLDLFAGVGLFSVHLGNAVGPQGRVVGVERNRRACLDARHNSNGLPQVSFQKATVTPQLLKEAPRADLVVLDPPREGAGQAVMHALAEIRARRIAYVSCDPATFARDIKVLLDQGWTMPSLRAMDLFPMTEHVELVALLEPPPDR